jgi:hypothetical protein
VHQACVERSAAARLGPRAALKKRRIAEIVVSDVVGNLMPVGGHNPFFDNRPLLRGSPSAPARCFAFLTGTTAQTEMSSI